MKVSSLSPTSFRLNDLFVTNDPANLLALTGESRSDDDPANLLDWQENRGVMTTLRTYWIDRRVEES